MDQSWQRTNYYEHEGDYSKYRGQWPKRYTKLKDLMEHYSPVLQRNVTIIAKEESFREGFTYLGFYIAFDYFKYCMCTACPYRTFYELIPAKKWQKPYFDVDIEVPGLSEKELDSLSQDVQDDLVDAIMVCLPTVDEQAKLEDLLVCYSHRPGKRSIHLIIPTIAFTTAQANKLFCTSVVEHMKPDYQPYIDLGLYKENQLFRLLGCRKVKYDNRKMFQKRWLYKGKEIYPYNRDWECRYADMVDKNTLYPNSPPRQPEIVDGLPAMVQEPGVVSQTILLATMICFTPNSKVLVSYGKVPRQSKINGTGLKQTQIESVSLDEEDITAVKGLLADYCQQQAIFEVGRVSGNLICLKRLIPSKCAAEACKDKIHEHENAYLVVRDDREVHFFCRRDNTKTPYVLGSI